MTIGRSKSHQEMDTQMDRLADEFRKNESADETHELERDVGQNSEGGAKCFRVGEIWATPFRKLWLVEKEKNERTKRKGEKHQIL